MTPSSVQVFDVLSIKLDRRDYRTGPHTFSTTEITALTAEGKVLELRLFTKLGLDLFTGVPVVVTLIGGDAS